MLWIMDSDIILDSVVCVLPMVVCTLMQRDYPQTASRELPRNAVQQSGPVARRAFTPLGVGEEGEVVCARCPRALDWGSFTYLAVSGSFAGHFLRNSCFQRKRSSSTKDFPTKARGSGAFANKSPTGSWSLKIGSPA